MTVDEATFPLSNSARPWPPGQADAAEGRSRSAEPTAPADVRDELPAPLVSPPLIPRIFPGL